MILVDCEQLSPEWWEAKRGIPSASDFDKIVTPKKMELSEQADGYICELIAGIIYPSPNYFTVRGRPVSQAMQDGIDNEPAARKWYELQKNVDCRRVGFCTTDDGRLGCSPDGLVGEDGGIEIKAPELKTQLKYLLDGTLPNDYKMQVHGSLIVTGRKWWDFFSYCPPAPPFLIRVTPNEVTKKLEEGLKQFLVRYDAIMQTLGVKLPQLEAA